MTNLETRSREELIEVTFECAVLTYRAIITPEEPSLMEIRDLRKYSIQAVDDKLKLTDLRWGVNTEIEAVDRLLWFEYGINRKYLASQFPGSAEEKNQCTAKSEDDLIRLWHQVTHRP